MCSKIFSIVLFFFIAVSTSYSQEEVYTYPMTESSLLWEISGNDIPEGSYLFGTMHIMEAEHYFFPDTLTYLIRHSDVLINEIDESLFDPNLMSLLLLDEGSFFDFFNQAQRDSIYTWAREKLLMDSVTFQQAFDKMKPFVFAQVAGMLDNAMKSKSYEIEFQQLANQNGIEIEGLETAEEQIALFDSLSYEEQTEMVMSSIRENTDQSDIRKVQEMYLKQNVDSLYMLLHEDKSFLEGNEDLFLTNRNKKWISILEDALAKQRCFIAVGAGHLGGPEGLIRLLQKEGYTLKPVEL